jgi:hypothetical protein
MSLRLETLDNEARPELNRPKPPVYVLLCVLYVLSVVKYGACPARSLAYLYNQKIPR